MKRHEAREKAVQVLFQLGSTDMVLEDAMAHVLEDTDAPTNAFFEQIVQGTAEHKEQIDAEIEKNLENWSLDRLPKIEKTVLRLAIYELLFMPETPNSVVLNEAIELCKTFSDDKSAKFVNGVLSKMID